MPSLNETLRETFYAVNGIRMHCLEAGPAQGPVALLLHGFPENWRAWTAQIPPLARAGLRVVVPDLRGYNLSSKPSQVEDYRISSLLKDLTGLLDALGAPQAYIAGHDWGGILAWDLAIEYPERVARLAVLNAPHPARSRAIMKTLGQLRKSWYVGFFQLPWLPEKVLPSFGAWALRGTHRDAFSPADHALYRQAWKQRGAPRGMVNYYRALLRYGHERQQACEQVSMPTLVIWGLKDAALQPSMSQGLERWVSNLKVVRLPHASHWVMRDEPVKVNNLLLDFFGT